MYDEITKKVLIVEDDGALRNILKSSLGLKYNIAEAMDGVQALERFELFRPDLVLLDLLLPKKDGFEVLKAIREAADPEAANVVVVIFSNLSTAEDVMKTKNLKADAYFIKSQMDLKELQVKIAELLKLNPETESETGVVDFTHMG